MKFWHAAIVSLMLLALGSTGCRCCRSDHDYDYPSLSCGHCASCDCSAPCEATCEASCEPTCEPACQAACEPSCAPTCGYTACDHCNQGRDRCRNRCRVSRNGHCCMGIRGVLAWIFCVGTGCGNCCDNYPPCPVERAGSAAMMYDGAYYEQGGAPMPPPAASRGRPVRR